ncbi:serine/threonine-protein kinase [Sphaerisporangium sp. TRM90804]|uniref:serine/threonine-protein kinase n=1 Tax=Sphaerisporangium sp. TRM90804 TaxID=3031113 RepID=UPI0024477AD9|nr:serine/threonine-protein kinase [Sphaerisporangium sp. TRM90804]MDH2424203.1 protein kinase [Sphaerisporangium sp. TRM90804]
MAEGRSPAGAGVAPEGQGRLVGRRYRLLSPVGRGGMGMVWHAHDVLLDRDVAVKELILPLGLDHAGTQVAHRRMLREARSAARLSHPGIVTVHDVVEEDGRPWIVMELVRAWSLEQAIRQSGPLPVVQAAEIGVRVLDALRHAHAAGILHRDVKPGNVLLTADRVVLTDFGIAAIEGDVTVTQTGLLMGSPAYIPPERLQGRPITHAADLWSFGATLYAAVEGRPPYEGPDAVAVLGAVLTQEPNHPQRAGALLPVIDGLLRKNPADRMPAGQAADLLERVLRTHGSGLPIRGADGHIATPLPTRGDPTPMQMLPPLDPPSGPIPSRIIETPSGPVRVPIDPRASGAPSGPFPARGGDPSGPHRMPFPTPAGYDALDGPTEGNRRGPFDAERSGGFPDPLAGPSGGHPAAYDALRSASGPQTGGYGGPPPNPYDALRSQSGAYEMPGASTGPHRAGGPYDALGGPSGPQRPGDDYDALGSPSGSQRAGGYDALSSPSGGQRPGGPFEGLGGSTGPHRAGGSYDALGSPSGGQRPGGPFEGLGGSTGPHRTGGSYDALAGPSGPYDALGGASGPQPGLYDALRSPSGPFEAPGGPGGARSGDDVLVAGSGGRRGAGSPNLADRLARDLPADNPFGLPDPRGPEPRPGDTGPGRRVRVDDVTAEPAREGRSPLLLILAGVGVVGVVAALLFVLWPSGGTAPSEDLAAPLVATSAPPAPSGGQPQEEEDAVTDEPSAPSTEIPSDFRAREAAGVSVAVPEDWTTSASDAAVTYTGPKSSGRRIQIKRVPATGDDGLQALTQAKDQATLTDYAQARLESSPFGEWRSSVWEYTYTSLNNVTTHAVTRFIAVDDDHAYQVTFTAPDAEWEQADNRQTMAVLWATFKPAG